MQFPKSGETVALEFHDVFAGEPEVLIARRRLNRWIDVRSGKPLLEKGRTMCAVRWWPLREKGGILLVPRAQAQATARSERSHD